MSHLLPGDERGETALEMFILWHRPAGLASRFDSFVSRVRKPTTRLFIGKLVTGAKPFPADLIIVAKFVKDQNVASGVS